MLKKLFEIYPPAMGFFLSNMPAKTLARRGAKFALHTLHQASTRVPAYQQFLDEHGVKVSDIQTIEDFGQLPVMEKENYLYKYPIEDLCLDGVLKDKYLIDSSSGYSGKRSFWPRSIQEDEGYPTYMESAYRQFYRIDQQSTLMIVTLGLGTWVGGEKISWATRQIAIRGRNRLTVVTPGPRLEEIIDILKRFAHHYEQVVLVGYPPFMKLLVDEGARNGISWQNMNVKIGLGGESYSEEWRDYMGRKIGLDENDFLGIAGGYGAADLGMSVGREYPITVLLRKLAYQNEGLSRDLFGQWKPMPSLCQYNPSTFFIEALNDELIFTAMPGIPIVRYNIHDRGGVISFDGALEIASDHGYDLVRMLSDHGYQKRDIWQLPLFYVWGRSDGSASIYGILIYAESIKAALDDPDVSTQATGNFVMETILDKDQNPRLQIKVELASGIKATQELEERFIRVIVRALEEHITEYAGLQQAVGEDAATPIVLLFGYQDPEVFDPQSIKYRYTSSQ